MKGKKKKKMKEIKKKNPTFKEKGKAHKCHCCDLFQK